MDDEEPILFAMREYFTTKGYAVDCARETSEAEALVAENDYSLAILDLRLSGTHGAEGLAPLPAGIVRSGGSDCRGVRFIATATKDR